MNRREASQLEYAEVMAHACLALCAAIDISEKHFGTRFPAQAIVPVLAGHLLDYANAAEESLSWDSTGLTGLEIDELCKALGSEASKVRDRLTSFLPNPKDRIKAEMRQLTAAGEIAKTAAVMCGLMASNRPANALVFRALRYTQRAIDGWHAACEAPASLRPAVGDE